MKNVYNYNKILNKITPYEYISFDLFDTLVKRDCYAPTELFKFIENKIDSTYDIKSNFCAYRINAEKISRKKNRKQEISLSDIYQELSALEYIKKYHIFDMEIKYELNLCQRNRYIEPILEYCLKTQKKIIVITDIYLPKDIIERILQKNEIPYTKFFISSEYGKMKRYGDLFPVVLSQLGISSNEILHIGDSLRSDTLIPKYFGINTVHIPTNIYPNLYLNKMIYRKNNDYRNLYSFISNHFKNKDNIYSYFYQSGYESLGPVLMGFIEWLYEKLRENHIRKVFFLSRDGNIMLRAFRFLNSDIEVHYMFASRKALIIPTLWMKPALDEIKNVMYWPRRGTIKHFFSKIGLDIGLFNTTLEQYGFSSDIYYDFDDLFRNSAFQEFYSKYVELPMKKNSKMKYDLLHKYLKQIHFFGRLALIDIGWNGSMQFALKKILEYEKIPADMFGYYLGIFPDSSKVDYLKAEGYLFSKKHNINLYHKEISFNSLVELFFTAKHGSVISYTEKKNRVIPVFANWEYESIQQKPQYFKIQNVQNGALAFISDVLKSPYFLFNNEPETVFANFIRLGCHPSLKDVKRFGDIPILDDDIRCIAKPGAILQYCVQGKRFAHDILYAPWKIGFLTRLSHLRLPYYTIYTIARRGYYVYKKMKNILFL